MTNNIHPHAARYMEERQQGKTFREIAQKYGVSQQAVARSCAIHIPDRFKPYHPEEVIYPKLRKWLNDNRISRSEFIRRIGLIPYANTIARFGGYFRGRNYPQKETIDKMLSVTGLTYEELFSLEET